LIEILLFETQTKWVLRMNFYIDIYGSYAFLDDSIEVSASIENVTDRDAPVVGNSAGSTSFNGGNTFPSHYSVLGRVYKLGFTYRIE
jgi:iron complex outermembrane receptor protein